MKPLTGMPVVARTGCPSGRSALTLAVGGVLLRGSLRRRRVVVRVSTRKKGPLAVIGLGCGSVVSPGVGTGETGVWLPIATVFDRRMNSKTCSP